MTKYTPSDEIIRDAYGAWSTGSHYVAEFDRWLAAHDAEVAAKALEDAADDLESRSEQFLATMQRMTDVGRPEYTLEDIVRYGSFSAEAQSEATRLRARAAGIREGAK